MVAMQACGLSRFPFTRPMKCQVCYILMYRYEDVTEGRRDGGKAGYWQLFQHHEHLTFDIEVQKLHNEQYTNSNYIDSDSRCSRVIV